MTVLDNARRLAGVRHGMRVFDGKDAPVGYVCSVKRADPLAIGGGQRIGQATDLLALLSGIRAVEPKVSSVQAAARLVRLGYIKIDGRSVDHVNRYAVAEEIREVTDDTVRLAVLRHTLTAQTL